MLKRCGVLVKLTLSNSEWTMKKIIIISTMILLLISCTQQENNKEEFQLMTEQFADVQILRYQVPGFENLDLKKKELLYYLYEAALSGREIIYDQNYKHNLTIKRTLEAVVRSYSGDRQTTDFENFLVYTKRVWFSNGIHHHYSGEKFKPEFETDYFTGLIANSDPEQLPLLPGETTAQFTSRLLPLIFDEELDRKRVDRSSGVDVISASANNYYENVTQQEVEDFYAKKIKRNDPTPVSYGLNSKLIKENGRVFEKTWKTDGMYGEALSRVVYWLEKAMQAAETEKQKETLSLLVEYYRSGDLRLFDKYNIKWIESAGTTVDVINGFIETYGDALGYRAAFESIVSFVDPLATKRIAAIGNTAQWFEDNSPIDPAHKKKNVTGISATVITVVVESGDASPTTPIGINLPNANWIRARHGSKSVSLGNIIDSYDAAEKASGMLEEFGYSAELNELERKYGSLADNLHTDMHEVIGHASGKINPGVGTPNETLKNYASTIEETRADLVALYYITDPKLVEIGVMPSIDAGKAQYINYIRNGMMWQLRRIKPGDNIEQSHMRNRQLIAKWAFEKGRPQNVIEKISKDGKTFFVINDYEKLRAIFGEMLREIQRIKSEGDFKSAEHLVETYGIQVDRELHDEVLERYVKLGIAPYSGFINPRLVPVYENDALVDVRIEYPDDFTAQMLEYAEKYAFLPEYN